jgi:hypothetical protein
MTILSGAVLLTQRYVAEHLVADLLAMEIDHNIGGPEGASRWRRHMAWRDLDDEAMRLAAETTRAS